MTDPQPRHSCDVCVAVRMVLDGFLHRLDDGLRTSMLAGPGGTTRMVDPAAVAAEVDEQRRHVLAAVAVWFIGRSLQEFDGSVTPIENCLANAFVENGITIYEPHIEERAAGGTPP